MQRVAGSDHIVDYDHSFVGQRRCAGRDDECAAHVNPSLRQGQASLRFGIVTRVQSCGSSGRFSCFASGRAISIA